VANVSQGSELSAAQDTTISQWTILVGPKTVLTAKSVVVNEATGEKFVIVGAVARRPARHPKFLAASARLISDMQA
jgi:V8-like Glu-specific endopeptidase